MTNCVQGPHIFRLVVPSPTQPSQVHHRYRFLHLLAATLCQRPKLDSLAADCAQTGQTLQGRSSCRPLVSTDRTSRTCVFALVSSRPFSLLGLCLLSTAAWGLAFCFSNVFSFGVRLQHQEVPEVSTGLEGETRPAMSLPLTSPSLRS